MLSNKQSFVLAALRTAACVKGKAHAKNRATSFLCETVVVSGRASGCVISGFCSNTEHSHSCGGTVQPMRQAASIIAETIAKTMVTMNL